MNKEESDECEVFRFVKYDKNWNRLAQCSVKGANTYIPFDAGGLSMTETDGKLISTPATKCISRTTDIIIRQTAVLWSMKKI